MLRAIEMRHLALLELVGEELVPEGHALVCGKQGHVQCKHNSQRTNEVMHALHLLRERLEKRWSEENERLASRVDAHFPTPPPFGDTTP